MSLFSQDLLQIESSNMVYICRLSVCIMELRHRGHASHSPIFIIFLFSLLSQFCMLTLKICVSLFSGSVEARILKLGIHMDNELLYCWI